MSDTNSSNNKTGGRPHGSVTCRRVKFSELQKHLGNEATVLASQSWLQLNGIAYEEDTPKE